MKYDVFISYKRKGGSGWAEMIRLGLIVYQSMSKEQIFMDVHNCSSDWKVKLEEVIKNANNVIVVISKDFEKQINANQSDDVWLYELDIALRYRRNIIPFCVDDIKKEDIQKIMKTDNIPLSISRILNENTWIMYDHDYPENSIKRIELKQPKDLSIKLTFTSWKSCKLLIPSIGGSPSCYKRIDDSNNWSCTIQLDTNIDKELKFIARREINGESNQICYHVFFTEYKENLELCEVKNDSSNIYCEIENRKDFDLDIDWERQNQQIVIDNLSRQADLMSGRVQNPMDIILNTATSIDINRNFYKK